MLFYDKSSDVYDEASGDNPEFEPVLYIIMRADLYQMNPGKGMAQAAHAANLFEHKIQSCIKATDNETLSQLALITGAVRKWRGDRGFGTTIVLEATEKEIRDLYDHLDPNPKYCLQFGLVYDPTYPYKNFYGDVYTQEELTCAYVFAANDDYIIYNENEDGFVSVKEAVSHMKLHR